MEKIARDIQANDRTIKKAEEITVLARQKNNAPAETAAREALQKAREAKAKNEETRARLQESHRRAQARARSGPRRHERLGEGVPGLIAERLADAGTVYKYALESLKARRDPPSRRGNPSRTSDRATSCSSPRPKGMAGTRGGAARSGSWTS